MTIALSAIASCGDGKVSDETSSTNDSTVSEAVSGSDVETKLTADIPADKYDGYTFRMLGREKAISATYDELFADTTNGDQMNDAVYKRNLMVSERFGIDIEKINSTNPASDIQKAVMGDEDAFDVAVGVTSFSSTALSSGYLLDTDTLTYVDTTKPWWKMDAIDSAAIAGKKYLLFGDMIVSDKNSTWSLCFNKKLYRENNLEEPYSMVRDGKWTMDVMKNHCKDITMDLNGDAVIDYKDQWGLLASNNAGIGLITSCNMKVADSTNDALTLALNNEKSIKTLSGIHDFLSDRTMCLRAEDIKGVSDIWVEIINIFREGRALYRISVLGDIVGFRDIETDFGIMPMPKLDENQEKYVTTYQGWGARCVAVPKTVTNVDRTSAILEYMASVSTDTLIKAYYDITLQRKVARDDDSAEMLDIIFDSVTTDIVLAFEIGGIRDKLSKMINSTSDTITSDIAKYNNSLQDQLNKLYDNVTNN